MRTAMVSLLALTLGGSIALAHGTIIARSDVPAQVYLDHRFVGTTPLAIRQVNHGTHFVTMRSLMGSGLSESIVIVPPGSTTTTVWGSFTGLPGQPFAPGWWPHRPQRYRDRDRDRNPLRWLLQPRRGHGPRRGPRGRW